MLKKKHYHGKKENNEIQEQSKNNDDMTIDKNQENKNEPKEKLEDTTSKDTIENTTKINQEKNTEPKFKKANKKPEKVKEEIKKMDNTKKKMSLKFKIAIITIILIILIFISTIFALVNIGNEKIISGISISGVDVSGLSKEEAIAKLNSIYNEKKEKDIKVKYKEYENTLSPKILEVNYKIEEAVDKAYKIGKENNIFINNYQILFTLLAKQKIDIEMTLNEEVTNQLISDMEVNLPGVLVNSSYAIEGDELIITKGKEGVLIDKDNFLNSIKSRLNDITINEDYLEIPVITKKPDEIDIQKIHDEVFKEPQNAYYEKDPFAVYPEVIGIDFDIEEAKKILQEDKEEYVIKLKLTNPEITLMDIGKEAFPDKLSEFTTRYDPGEKDRSANLELACEKLNGKVIMPGEEFSYNKTLGPRTVAAGYKNGKIYENGKVVDGIGGGICQISSTLYNAVLKANLEIVERRNHQFVTSYVGAGRDATVVYGTTDFRFKNTRQYPIRLVASSKNGVATIEIYGIKEENEYTFEFKTNPIATIPYTTQYIEDSSLPVGTEKVEQRGVNGLKTQTYIIKKLNGKVISNTLLSTDTYNAMTKIVRKGTKPVENNVNNATQTPTNNTNTENNTNNNMQTQEENNNTISNSGEENNNLIQEGNLN